ncbi:hypothetical protein OHA40_23145 [Nocardia sp. NBC_00508]|uniref:hypothetical protein n=1 Tax=Nocardia sp. NBC_00508 TaxID=2975992 RepID=UPI002E819095|nr:hypothetical protein [Nocardia sp. NBC_00508]WUD64567.1 hypothetical protein OHA40_23145 [Nocardia sp. NBC_00508]
MLDGRQWTVPAQWTHCGFAQPLRGRLPETHVEFDPRAAAESVLAGLDAFTDTIDAELTCATLLSGIAAIVGDDAEIEPGDAGTTIDQVGLEFEPARPWRPRREWRRRRGDQW